MSEQDIQEQDFDLDSVFDSAGGSSGAPSFLWPLQQDPKKADRMVPVIGGAIQGEITDIYVTVVKDVDTKLPKLNKNGKQQPQVNLTLQTALRNWEGVKSIPTDDNDVELPPEEDDGKRRIYVKYRLLDALSKAIKASPQGKGGPRVGAKVAVKITDLTYSDVKSRHPLPDYEAKYLPPAEDPAADIFNAQPAAAPAAKDPWAGAAQSENPPF